MEGKKDIQLIIKIDKKLSDKLNKYIKENCLNKSAFIRKIIEDRINDKKI
jgi:hypothetical protein